MIYELKVTLKHVGIPVWRKIQLNENTTFYHLHRILQVVFDWDNNHLHSFFTNKINGKRADDLEITGENNDGFTDLFGGQVSYNEHQEMLADWFKMSKDKITYVYDFGDDWHHEIVLSKQMEPEEGVNYPRCIGAKNAAPEEDTRGEVLMGEVDLAFPDSKQLVKDINQEIRLQLKDMLTSYEQTAPEKDIWHDLFLKTKEFLKLKPWDMMFDGHIFAVEDPVTKEWIYCSVLGGGGEVFGLAVYIGDEGYTSLMGSLSDMPPNFDFIVSQRSLLLSFEDREDLEKDDYRLVKSYDIPFRGRKSWPSFTSYKPGFYPWLMDDEEARLMLLGIERTMEVYQELTEGLEMPDLLLDEQILVKIPRKANGNSGFDNQVIGLEKGENNVEKSEVPLNVSEFELKRIEKLKTTLAVTIEFSMEYMDMPVQNEPGERPVFPLLVLAVDRAQGTAVYYNLLTDSSDFAVLQNEFLKLIETLKGIPENVMVNQQTARVLSPLMEKVDVNVEVENDLPLIRQVVDMMHDDMPFF